MTERGSVSVLILGIVGLMVAMGVVLGTAGHFLAVRNQAQVAADAAALAAAPVTFLPFGSDGRPSTEATRLATANGAQLARCICPIDRSWAVRVVEVEVFREVNLPAIGSLKIRAVAAAEFEPTRLLLGS